MLNLVLDAISLMDDALFTAFSNSTAMLRLSESNQTCLNCRAWAVSPFSTAKIQN